MTAGIILHAPLQAAPHSVEWQDALLQALPYARRLQVTSRAEAAQRATLGGLALALVAAERIAARAFSPRAFLFAQDGKPRLEAGPYFSVSHAESRVAVAASATLDLGLDIEDCLQDHNAAEAQKLKRWTATEAVLKARGLGLRDLSEITLDASLAFGAVRAERYELQLLDAIPGVIGHVAAPVSDAIAPEPVEWSIEELELGAAAFSAALERSLSLPPQFK